MESTFTPVTLPGYNTREYFVQIWNYLEDLHKIHITIHDHSGSLRLSDGNLLRLHGNIHRSGYCSYCREKFHRHCIQHCAKEAMQKASEAEGPMLYRCYAGVVEVVMPLFWQNVHVATIFGGSFRDADFVVPDSWDNQRKALYNDLPVWYRSKYPVIVQVLELLGAAALVWADKERNTLKDENSRRQIIEDFFRKKLTSQDCTLELLAEKLNLSTSRTSHILQEEFHKSFSKLLMEARVQRICDLLENTDLPLREIARRTGMSNEYYLNRIFRRKMGIPPGKYRSCPLKKESY